MIIFDTHRPTCWNACHIHFISEKAIDEGGDCTICKDNERAH